MDSKDVLFMIFFSFSFGCLLIGIVHTVSQDYNNVDSDKIVISNQTANTICERLYNNTNIIAVQWKKDMDEPKYSLVCKKITEEDLSNIKLID